MGGPGPSGSQRPVPGAPAAHPAWHTWNAERVAQALRSDLRRGLQDAEAAQRLHDDGPNELPQPKREGSLSRAGRQLREPMALLLIIAALVAGIGLGERADAIAILAIVILNATIGMVEEGRAARAVDALRAMERPTALVRREGRDLQVGAAELVAGDLVLLAAGDRIPADHRLIEASGLEVDESLLTGESLPVTKDPASISDLDAPLGDRDNMLYAGTLVTRGSARGLAVATGPRTELGAIAEQVEGREPPTPLQRELGGVAKVLGSISIAVAIGVFALILVRMGVTDEGLQRSFLAAVALAVAAVPEGLATVVAVGLALGVHRMAARNAIVRRLPAVETLGATTVIATDKTGTLTENRLEVDGFLAEGDTPVPADALHEVVREAATAVVALCNDASLEPRAGDALDLALLDGIGPGETERVRAGHRRRETVPFDAERKRMTVSVDGPDGPRLLIKGAPESILARCTQRLTPAGPAAFDAGASRAVVDGLAGRGRRMLALAQRAGPGTEEHDLTLIGFVALADTLRSTARQAVADAGRAGIRLVMVTGDHAGTAAAVAQEAGMRSRPVLGGTEIRAHGLPDDPASTAIYARVDPDQKLELVEALQGCHEIVAVTGDGVNDAPALWRADIGVAMGRAGSDVAREASDVIVTDDDLATIVAAVREGRAIYDNIRKVVHYLIAGNLSEILVVVSCLLLFPELGVPLLPLQLLWINLLTDGPPALALGVDPPDADIMERRPRARTERILAPRHLRGVAVRGLIIATAALAGLTVSRFLLDAGWPEARTVMFSALVGAHLLWALAVRDPRRPSEIVANRWLLFTVAGGIVLQVLVLALPATRELLDTVPLTPEQLIVAVAAATLTLPALLAVNGLGRRWARRSAKESTPGNG